MKYPILSLILEVKPTEDTGRFDWNSIWLLLPIIAFVVLVFKLIQEYKKGNFTFPSYPRSSHRTEANSAAPRPLTQPDQPRRANINQLPSEETPPPPPSEGPVFKVVGNTQTMPAGKPTLKVVEEWTGDPALRGDFVDIMGALGKKLDKVINETQSNANLIADLKKENRRIAEENKSLLDLLHHEQHRRLLVNLIKATSLCERFINHIKDNPEAIKALEFVRDECHERLIDAGLTAYSPQIGDRLANLDGTLIDPPAKTLPTDDPAKSDTVAEVIAIGYYYERDGKKLPIAKAVATFYKLSSISHSTP